MNTTEVRDVLNNLITRNNEAYKGYQEAADGVSDNVLKSWLKNTATRRSIHISDLQLHLRGLGGEIERSTSLLADLHRAWITIKSSIMNDDAVVIQECIRGEERALEDYGKVLKEKNIDPVIARTLSKHKKNIQEDLNSLKAIEETFAVAQ